MGMIALAVGVLTGGFVSAGNDGEGEPADFSIFATGDSAESQKTIKKRTFDAWYRDNSKEMSILAELPDLVRSAHDAAVIRAKNSEHVSLTSAQENALNFVQSVAWVIVSERGNEEVRESKKNKHQYVAWTVKEFLRDSADWIRRPFDFKDGTATKITTTEDIAGFENLGRATVREDFEAKVVERDDAWALNSKVLNNLLGDADLAPFVRHVVANKDEGAHKALIAADLAAMYDDNVLFEDSASLQLRGLMQSLKDVENMAGEKCGRAASSHDAAHDSFSWTMRRWLAAGYLTGKLDGKDHHRYVATTSVLFAVLLGVSYREVVMITRDAASENPDRGDLSWREIAQEMFDRVNPFQRVRAKGALLRGTALANTLYHLVGAFVKWKGWQATYEYEMDKEMAKAMKSADPRMASLVDAYRSLKPAEAAE